MWIFSEVTTNQFLFFHFSNLMYKNSFLKSWTLEFKTNSFGVCFYKIKKLQNIKNIHCFMFTLLVAIFIRFWI